MCIRRSVRASSAFLLSLLGAMAAPTSGAEAVPDGFTPLFNGKDLTGWHGEATMDPLKRAALPAEELARKQAADQENALEHWRVDPAGELVNDGGGVYLTTDRHYGDIELLIDWKITPKADSGVYLRGTPQVQIWDPTDPGKLKAGGAKGSGGLWNNSPGRPGKDPLVVADRPAGEWNRFRILQLGARTWIHLNDTLVVDGATMENYWDRKRPLSPTGPIQLQTHGGEMRWKNIQLREVSAGEANDRLRAADDGFVSLFNGRDLTGWTGAVDNYQVEDGAIMCKPGKGGVLHTAEEYGDFVARLEFQLPPGGNNGLAIRYPGKGDAAYSGMCELQVLDSEHPKYKSIDPRQAHGSAYGMVAAHRGYLRPAGEWNYQEVTVRGSTIRVELNGVTILDTDLAPVKEFMANSPHPGKDLAKGFFGFAGHGDPVRFRRIAIRALAAEPAAEPRRDVVVYGATSGGIVAAIQAKALGKSVVVVEPGRHIGGLTAGGLGATDIGNKGAIGGLAREFYRRIGRFYAADAAWRHEQREAYRAKRKSAGEQEMWTFEPHVAERVYREWLAEAGIVVVTGERLDLAAGGVEKQGRRIVAFRTESGRRFAGTMFIDATYEGDLMAKAGVSYHVGREAESVHGESLNGIRAAHARKHQFTHDVDPYVVPGDPQSGLVPLVSPDPPGLDGAGDQRVQAYNFRMCTTDVPENRRDWPKPEGYDERQYELLLRNFEAGDHRVPWNPVWMPNRKTDTNNNFAISTDYIGANYAYPEAGHAERERIVADHRRYQQGLMWTLANHARVPEVVRSHFQRLGLAKDEFTDNDNWPHQLYVREARRMISDYVMTQHDCQWHRMAEDPVGLGAYNMDSHNCQRYVTEGGVVRNEGDIQVGVKPYRISWRSIRPRREECENLLVPVCLAASHIAYGSIRMEPVFMVLGQSAATAAAFAIDAGAAIQDVDYARLRVRLLADGQVLEWQGGGVGAVDPAKLPGVVVDNTAARIEGDWSTSASIGGFVGP